MVMKRRSVMTSPSIEAHHLLDSRYACFPSSNPRLGPDSQHAVAPTRQQGEKIDFVYDGMSLYLG